MHIGRLFAVAKKDEFAGALIDLGMRRDMQAGQSRIQRQGVHRR
jgi:hypothetical protein